MSLEDTLRTIVREEIRAALGERSESAWQGAITLKEAAALVRVSISTLEKWGKEGLVVTKRGHVRRVDVSALREFMSQQQPEQPTSDAEWVERKLAKVSALRGVR